MSWVVQVNTAVSALSRAKAQHVKRGDVALQRLSLRMSRTARREAPKATSQLTQSINFRRVRPLLWEVFTGTRHAGPQEKGRKPGRRPPVPKIQDWLEVKRIQPRNPNMSQRDLAFLVARAIGERGTKPQPYMSTAFDRHHRELTPLLRRAKVGLP